MPFGCSELACSIAKQNLIDQHRQRTNSLRESKKKITTLRLCTNDNSKFTTPYNKFIKSLAIRKWLVQLRLDKSMKHTDIICDLCKTEFNSQHIITECIKTEDARIKFLGKISEILPGYICMPKIEQVITILNFKSNNDNVRDAICSYMKNVL